MSKLAFLFGLLPDNEVQYMEQPADFEEKGEKSYMMCNGVYG